MKWSSDAFVQLNTPPKLISVIFGQSVGYVLLVGVWREVGGLFPRM